MSILELSIYNFNNIEIIFSLAIIGEKILMSLEQFMNRIRELRKQVNLTQKELAKRLQIANSTLSYWEMGKYEPDNDSLIKLSRFFNVPIDYILDGDFAKWDITESRSSFQSSSVSAGHLNDADLYVSESEVLYNKKKSAPEQCAAFNRIEFEDLTQKEIDLLAEYAMFIKSRRKKNK